jgi:hypothetical protein
MNIDEITDPAHARELLKCGGLDIILAGQTGDSFQAAHGDHNSVLVLSMQGQTTVWHLTGAPKEERKRAAERVRTSLVTHGATLRNY